MLQKNKRGSTDWTVNKLLTIVLLAIVLILVIYGFTSGGFKPLIEKYEGRFNEVIYNLDHLNFWKENSEDACLKRSIGEVYQGETFLEELKYLDLDEKNIKLTQCTNGECYLEGSEIGKWFFIKENLVFQHKSFENPEGSFRYLYKDDFFQEQSIKDAKFNYEFYLAATNYLEQNQLEEEYASMFQDISVFYSKAFGSKDLGIFALGEHNDWSIYVEGSDGILREYNKYSFQTKIYKGLSTKEMLEFFLESTYKWEVNDKIYYSTITFKESKNPSWNNLLTYNGEDKFSSSSNNPNYDNDNELNEESDAQEIEMWLEENANVKIKYLHNLENPGFFETSPLGESIIFEEEVYNINIENIGENECSFSNMIYEDDYFWIRVGEDGKEYYIQYESGKWTYSRDNSNWKGARENLEIGLIDEWTQIIRFLKDGEYLAGVNSILDECDNVPLVTFDSSKKAYALSPAPPFSNEKFPVILTEYKNGNWQEIGNEADYKLSKEAFDKKYKITAIKKFLENNCPS